MYNRYTCGIGLYFMCGLQLNCLIILLYEFLIIADLFKQANEPDFHAFFRNCISFSLTTMTFAFISSFQSSNL